NMSAFPKIDEVHNENDESSEEAITPQPTVLFQREAATMKTKNIAHVGGSGSKNSQRVSFTEQKENAHNGGHYSNESSSNTGSAVQKPNAKVAATLQSMRAAELNRLRATARSPMRTALANQTAAVVQQATSNIRRSLLAEQQEKLRPDVKRINSNNRGISAASVNQSLNAIRKAKKEVIHDKSKSAKNVRFQWEQENSEAKVLKQKVEENRRQIRTIQRQLSSAHFKDKARKEEAEKFQRFAKLEEEYKFNSEVHRDHQLSLKEQRDRERRMSTDVRAKIRRNKREGEERMRMKQIEEDQAIFDVKADLHRARMEAARSNAEDRRKSFQFRAGDARRIRGIRASWKEKEFNDMHQGFELERAAARDVDNYKKQVAEEERKSVRNDNVIAKKGRKRQEDFANDAMYAQHASYELKWAGERDAEAYKKRMQEERRKSLAGRNKESVRHAKVMEELRSIAQEKEAESYMLKWAGEKDAEAYLKKMEEERRQSLQQRGRDARKARQYEEEQHAKAVSEAIADGEIQSACQKDVEQYQSECAERRRMSLQHRGKHMHMNRLQEEEQRIAQMQKQEADSMLESLAQKDVEGYYKDCKRRRRKSLALRAKERRQHAKWKQKKQQETVRNNAHSSYLNSLDVQHMALAKEQERARRALDALRGAGFQIKGNPFKDLLKGL
ncbi:MAG: hypothetical protein SGILL_006934, partial [Bacillariaceae sp.]